MMAFDGLNAKLYGGLDSSLATSVNMSVLNFDSNAFTVQPTTATSARYSSSYVQWKDMIVSYGGFLGGSLTSSTMFLNINTFASEEIAGNSPTWTVDKRGAALVHTESPCTEPLAVVDPNNDLMYIFGGLTEFAMLNSVTKINLANRTVYGIADTTSARPLRRYGSAGAYITVAGVPYLYIFGGLRQKTSSEPPQTLGDEHLLNLRTEDWVSVSSVFGGSRSLPPPRCYASMTLAPNGDGVILFGGENRINLATTQDLNDAWFLDLRSGSGYTWTQIATNGTAPTPRSRVASLMAENNGEVALLLHGGSNSTAFTFGEMWKLVFGPCPYGINKCFTDNPNSTSTTTTTSTSTTTGIEDTGGSGGSISGNEENLSTGKVNVGSVEALSSLFSLIF